MSVPEQVPYKEYRATGSNNSFEITFYLPDPKDLVVMVNKEIPPVGAYSIQGNTVVFNTPPNEGDLVELTRDTQLDRETNFKSYDNSFRPETINFDLDKIWLVLQESNLVDAKILARLKQEIEWRRTHDFNYDELAQVREKQLFDALKGYADTLYSATNPNVFAGVIAGVVFARDGKSIQTHIEEILDNLAVSREDIDSKAGQQYVDEQLNLKANSSDVYLKSQTYNKSETYSNTEVDTKFSAYVGGRKAYTTLALAQAAQSSLPANTVVDVTNDPTPANNGTYQWNGTTLTKSAYDPLTQAKTYTDDKTDTVEKTLRAEVFGTASTPIVLSYTTKDGYITKSGGIASAGTAGYKITSPIFLAKGVTLYFDYYGAGLVALVETNAGGTIATPSLIVMDSQPENTRRSATYTATKDMYVIASSLATFGELVVTAAIEAKPAITDGMVSKSEIINDFAGGVDKVSSAELTKKLNASIERIDDYIAKDEPIGVPTEVGGFAWDTVTLLDNAANYNTVELSLAKNAVLTFDYSPINGTILWDWRDGVGGEVNKGWPLLTTGATSSEVISHTFTAYAAMKVRVTNSAAGSIKVNGVSASGTNVAGWAAHLIPIKRSGGAFASLKRSLPFDVKKGDVVTVNKGAVAAISIVRLIPDTAAYVAVLGQPQALTSDINFVWEADVDCTIAVSGISDATFSVRRKGYSLSAKLGNSINSGDMSVPTYMTLPPRETVFATSMNYILKTELIDGVDYIKISQDLGKTWTQMPNILGDIVSYHFFSDGTIMLCSPEKVYWTRDYLTLNESTVYDHDGSVFVPSAKHFFCMQTGDSISYIDDQEIYVWGDYLLSGTARIWYSLDRGRTIKCAAKFGTTLMGGVARPIRHVHRVYYHKASKSFYITTGDNGDECMIIHAIYDVASDAWTWDVLNTGIEYKFGNISIDSNNIAYMVTDYTDISLRDKKGIYRVPVSDLGDITKYQMIYNAKQSDWGSIAPVVLMMDKNGNKVLQPDWLGAGYVWVAREGLDFRKVTLSEKKLLAYAVGENYNGDIYCMDYIHQDGNLRLNRGSYNITKMLRDAGITNFMMGVNIIPNLDGIF